MTVSGVATQGRSDSASWVTKYKIKHSKDGTKWVPFEEIGIETVRKARKSEFVSSPSLCSF